MCSLTVTLFVSSINTGTGNQDIVDDSEAAFAAHPLAIAGHDASIVKHGCLVQQDTATVDRASEGYLVGVKEVKA